MQYSRIFLIVSFLLLCGALFFLPSGWRQRVSGAGKAFAAPGEALAAASLRVSREVLGGLPEDMTVAERDALLVEVTRSRQEIAGHQQEMADLRTENRYLTRLLRYVKSTTQYTLVVSQVIRRRELSAYNDTLLVNRGSADGLLPGQAVLSVDGFVGVVISTSSNSSIVRLHTSDEFTMAVEVPAKGVSAIIENRDGILYLTALTGKKFDALRVGDQVQTSELGSDTMQAGLCIGTVAGIEWAADGSPAYRVNPAAACDDLQHLMVAIPALRGKP
jgi:rod shape-determining protein MreC